MSNFTSWYRVVQPCGCVDTNTSMLGKRPLVCLSDCLTQSSRWIVFNGNWQQLNSLAPFGGPLLLVFFFYLNSWPSIKALTLVRCQVFSFFFSLLRSKSVLFLFKGEKSNSSLCRMENNGYFPRVFACMCAKKELKYQLLPSPRQEVIPCAQVTQSSTLLSHIFLSGILMIVEFTLFSTTDCISHLIWPSSKQKLIIFDRWIITFTNGGGDRVWLNLFEIQ